MRSVVCRAAPWVASAAATATLDAILGHRLLAVALAGGAAAALAARRTSPGESRTETDADGSTTRTALIDDLLDADEQARHQVVVEQYTDMVATMIALRSFLRRYDLYRAAPDAQQRLRSEALVSLEARLSEVRGLLVRTRPTDGVGDTPTRLRAFVAASIEVACTGGAVPATVVDIDDEIELPWAVETAAMTWLRGALGSAVAGRRPSLVRVRIRVDQDRLVLDITHDSADETFVTHIGVRDTTAADDPVVEPASLTPTLRLVTSG